MAQAWKTVRVFISSTFRDMHAERDHLVRFVLPRLKEDFLKRRMHLVDVDLRWGVTADQDAFELCMDEIDRCRPRFICILGGRYGWVPPPKSIEADFMAQVRAGTSPAGALTVEQQAILDKLYAREVREDGTEHYRLREKPREKDQVEVWNADSAVAVEIFQRAGLPEAQFSITASEVLYGALEKKKLDEPLFRYFYFRDPAVTQSIPEPHTLEPAPPRPTCGRCSADFVTSWLSAPTLPTRFLMITTSSRRFFRSFLRKPRRSSRW
jgi:hypothetical protein